MRRRFCSILFLFLIALNVIGYSCLFFIEKQKSKHTAAIIEGNANEISGNVIFRLPMDFPNPESAKHFRPVDGQINYDGEVYHLVKQKLYQDTLYVVCIKDTQANEIRQAMHDYAESFTDNNTTPKTNTGLKLFSALSQDYIPSYLEIEAGKAGWARTLEFTRSNHRYSFTPISLIFQPPQLNS